MRFKIHLVFQRNKSQRVERCGFLCRPSHSCYVSQVICLDHDEACNCQRRNNAIIRVWNPALVCDVTQEAIVKQWGGR